MHWHAVQVSRRRSLPVWLATSPQAVGLTGSAGLADFAVGLVGPDANDVVLGETGRRSPWCQRPVDLGRAMRLASATASTILGRIRQAPAATASASYNATPVEREDPGFLRVVAFGTRSLSLLSRGDNARPGWTACRGSSADAATSALGAIE